MENYEAFLLDLWEGTLSEEGKIMLSRFLEENPELKEDDALDLLNDISIVDAHEVFDKSTIRFDEINLNNYEYFFIAYAEGDLSQNEMSSVDEFLNENPALSQKCTQFKKAKLPLETIEYPNKEKLVFGKSRLIILPIQRFMIGLVAASIAFFIYLNIPINDSNAKYKMSNYEKLEIDKPDVNYDDSENINEYQIAEESENAAVEKRISRDSKNLKDFSPSTPLELASQEDENNINVEEIPKEKALGNVSKLEVKEFSEVTTAVVLVKTSTKENDANSVVKAKEKIPTIADLTAEYLQKKNILNEERKPDVKGIINSFSNVNENKKPIIFIEEEEHSKTTVFQLGTIKVERKKRK